MIMHLGPTVSYRSKYFFATCIRKAMSNQIAYEIIQEIRIEEEKKSEVTQPESPSAALQ